MNIKLHNLQYLRQLCETPAWHRTAYRKAKLVLGTPSGNAKHQLGEGIELNNAYQTFCGLNSVK